MIAAVIVNWNSGDDLARAVTDLRLQRGIELRVIVVDNASSDASLELASAAGVSFETIHAGANLGYSGGNNLGFTRLSPSDAVLVLNPDVRVPDPGAIAALASLLRAHPEFGAMAPTIKVGDEGLIEYRGSELDLEHAVALHRETNVRGWPSGTPEVVELPWIDGAALLIRREALDQVGGFDDQFFLFQEEVDWCIRAGRLGWRVGVARDVSVSHRRSSSFGGSGKGAYYYWRNLYLLCTKHARGRVKWRWHWLLGLLAFGARRRHLRDGRSGRAVAALRDALIGRYGALEEDRAVCVKP
jgi:GT2 family glycosyltransferase